MTRRNPHGELKGFSKKDAKYIEQSDTKCPSCNSSSSIISDSNMKGFVKTCDSSRCGWHQILHGAESFDAEYSVDKLSKMSFREIDRKSGFLGDMLANFGVMDSWTELTNSKRKEILNKIKKKESWLGWEAESFEARDDDFKEMKWTFDDLEESEGAGPSVLRPERTYSREDAEIEDMIDRVMERLYYFRKMYYTAKKERNRKAMYIAIRNFKALEGVNQALRWTLGEKGVGHPLY